MARSVSRRRTRRLRFESLESRQMLAVYTVTVLADAPVSAADAAPGTLRQAIFDANRSPGADVIRFAAGLEGSIDLAFVDDQAGERSALVVGSPITIEGNAAGITIRRDVTAEEMRLFRVTAAGSLTLERVALAEGVARGASDSVGRGGAIYNEGTLEISASTLYNHRAIGGDASSGSDGSSGLGGAIFNDGGSVMLVNATLSGNAAQSGAGAFVHSSLGGGVFSRNGNLSIYNSTITRGSATTGNGVYVLGVGAGNVATAEIYSSIIGGSTMSPFNRHFIAASDEGGEVSVSGANNLIRSQTDFHEITISAEDPLLASLADNGGPTLTHALSSDSPGINGGVNPRGLASDQRGPSYARVIGGEVDIGAFELQTISEPVFVGDYNHNDVVDAADYVLWRKSLGAEVPASTGADGSGNGMVDTDDYELWRRGFGSTNGGAGGQSATATANYLSHFGTANQIPDTRSLSVAAPTATLGAAAAPAAVNVYDAALLAWLAERGSEHAPAAAPGDHELDERDGEFAAESIAFPELTSFASFS